MDECTTGTMKPRGSDLHAVCIVHNNENNMITSVILDDGALSGDFSFVENKHKPTTRAPPSTDPTG